jgi:hypothetical protein
MNWMPFSLRSWLSRFTSRTRKIARRPSRPRPFRPGMETLEERVVLDGSHARDLGLGVPANYVSVGRDSQGHEEVAAIDTSGYLHIYHDGA